MNRETLTKGNRYKLDQGAIEDAAYAYIQTLGLFQPIDGPSVFEPIWTTDEEGDRCLIVDHRERIVRSC